MSKESYGTAILKANKWELRVEPQVRLRLKRMFPAMRGNDVLEMQATEANARDLHWVVQRYPLTMVPGDKRLLAQTAMTFDERARYFDELLSGYRAPRAFELAVPARDYQRQVADLALSAKGLLIADDMGLGKTCSAICALSDPDTLPALIVTLTALPWQWQDELKKFAPQLNTLVLKQAQPYNFCGDYGDPPDVLITSYSRIASWAPEFVGGIRSVVFDEVQELRHSGTQKYDGARAVAHASKYRIGLSGTPIYNMGGEFFNVLDVLCPDALGTWEEFTRTWCTGSDRKASIADPEAFGAYLREAGLMVRRTRAMVKRELPEFQEIVHYVDHDTRALDQVSHDVRELARFVLSQTGSPHARMQASSELDWKMRQATGIAKAPFVASFVRLLLETEQRVVLFGWHHAVYRIWRDMLAEFNPVQFTGQETPEQKAFAKRAFCEGDSRVLIMSLRSGAGLDGLQRVCRTAVFGEFDWAKGVMDQCGARLHRDEQPDPVTAYYLACREGSDDVILDALGVKAGQLRGVLDPGAALVSAQTDPARIKRLAESVLSSGLKRAS